MESNQWKFIRYISDFAVANATHIWLGGSFRKGTATLYSDVDISVYGDSDRVKQLIYGYGNPVFLSRTSNPPGILVVVYEDGVAVDLEVVRSIDISGTEYFHKEDIKQREYQRDETAFRDVVSRDDEPYQVSRLFHRSLCKYLSGKKELGVSVANEIAAFMEEEETVSQIDYSSRIKEMAVAFSKRYPMEEAYEKILRDMIVKTAGAEM